MSDLALIALPDPGQAPLFYSLLLESGLRPALFRDGRRACDALVAEGPPAIVVTDLSLTGRDGFELLALLQELSPGAATPAIAVSAFPELIAAAWRRRDELGLWSILPRHADAGAFRRAIERALAGQRDLAPEIPVDEAAELQERQRQRSAEIAQLRLVDDLPPEETLQQLVADTAQKFGVPISLVSLILDDRQWFKAHVGLSGQLLADRGTPRDWAFCRHVVDGCAPLVVPDARNHPVFADNPLVLDGSVASYAGAPLITPSGQVLGTLCILDKQPLAIGDRDVDELVALARRVAGEIELRRPWLRSLPPVAAPYLVALLEQLEDGVLLVSPQRRVLFANRALGELADLAPERIMALSLDEWVVENARLFDDPDRFLRDVAVLPAGPFAARVELELQRPRRRVIRWVAKPVRLPDGIGQLCVYSDVTAEVDLARQREQLARTDGLTGLANRRGGEEAITREVARSRRSGDPLSFALFDLDHFKSVNDRFGHAAGDRVLTAVSQLLATSVRATDLAIRWGGEELLAVLPTVTIDGARVLAQRVVERAAAIDHLGVGRVTLSAGIAELHPGEDPEAAVARADEQLYQAKRDGRGRVR